MKERDEFEKEKKAWQQRHDEKNYDMPIIEDYWDFKVEKDFADKETQTMEIKIADKQIIDTRGAVRVEFERKGGH